jgi:hypothetical protein
LRWLLILVWVCAALALIFVVLSLDAAAGNTGIVRLVGLFVVLPILGKAFQMIWRV